MLTLFVWLFLGHFVCDITLQSDFVAIRKSPLASLPNIPWYYVMLGHAATHGAMVGLLTNNPWLAVYEMAFHFWIDVAKCKGRFGIHVDQGLHVLCKLCWVGLFYLGWV